MNRATGDPTRGRHLWVCQYYSNATSKATTGHTSHHIFIRHTDPCPVFPSNTKKFAMGGSRAANVFNISWPRTPPITAQTAEISQVAVIATCLGLCRRVGQCGQKDAWDQLRQEVQKTKKTDWSIFAGIDLMTRLLTSAAEKSALAIDSSSGAWVSSFGNMPPCRDWNSHKAEIKKRRGH